MNVKRLIFWAAVFCGLLCYVVMFEAKAPRPEKAAAPQQIKVFPFPSDSIQKIILQANTRKAELLKTENGWELSAPQKMALTQENVESLISTITSLIQIEVVSEDVQDLRQFGLDDPAMSIALYRGNDNQPVVLDVGSNTPTGVSMYAMVRGSNEVIQIGTLLRFSINSFFDMLDRLHSS